MIYFAVKNHEKFQHYRDRNPVWIKFYYATLEDYDFAKLPDASKAHLLAIWLLASRSGNKIPWDKNWISARISATDPVNLDVLEKAGFIIKINGASDALAEPEHFAILETETETETEIERKIEINPETFARTEKPPQGVLPTLPINPSVASSIDADFIEWYSAYPKKIAKGHAKRAYTAARKKVDHSVLLAGAKRYAANPKRKPDYTANPATWLTGERWLDEASSNLTGGQAERKTINGPLSGQRPANGKMPHDEFETAIPIRAQADAEAPR